MLGIQYGSGKARYLVDLPSGLTIGRFNSLAQAKTLIKSLSEWRLYDHGVIASVSSNDGPRTFEPFLAKPELYPHMKKCAVLRARLKKSSCKPIK